MRVICILSGLILMVHLARGQETFANTLFFDASVEAPDATLDDIAWIQGHWRGEAFGGTAEEIWSPPLGPSMMCVFKHLVNGEVTFYELVTISEEAGSLILRLKHFDPRLVGWEEKGETQDFRLVKVTQDKVYFEGFTFERINPDEINIYVVIEEGEKKTETTFNYYRVK